MAARGSAWRMAEMAGPIAAARVDETVVLLGRGKLPTSWPKVRRLAWQEQALFWMVLVNLLPLQAPCCIETAEARPDDNDGMVFRHRRRDSTGVRSCETPGNHS